MHPAVQTHSGSRNRLSSVSSAAIQTTDADTPEPSAAAQPVSLPRAHMSMPPPLRGSFESLARQNEKTEADGLERIQDEDDLADRIARKMLVPLPASASLTVNGNLPENHRYCRPWTASFLADLARAHGARFHRSLEVSSAVRTVEYQKRLMETNGNAAAAEGDVASPHLTGATIDIAKQGLSRDELGWMRAWLLALQQNGKLDVEEEFRQACFHITVYKSYVPPRPASRPTPSPAKQASGRTSGTGPAKAAATQAETPKPIQPKPIQSKPVPPKPHPSQPRQLKPAQPKQKTEPDEPDEPAPVTAEG
jgi:hypothetical protein